MTADRTRFLVIALLLAVAAAPPVASQDPVLRVIAMPREEKDASAGTHQGRMVDESLLEDWRRLRDQAVAQGATIIVLEVTTPGGMVTTAELMTEDLRDLRQQGIRTVGFVPHHATSAGAIITLACKEVFMAPRATLGNVIPLKFRDLVSMERAPEKAITKVKTMMRQIAREGGFPELLLEAMVDPDIELIQVFRDNAPTTLMTRDQFEREFPDRVPRGIRTSTLVGQGEALEIFGEDAALMNLPVGQAISRDDLPRVLGLGTRDLAPDELLMLPAPRAYGPLGYLLREIDWSIIFLIAGIAFFILELKTPGLGIAGVLGILSFVAYFALQSETGASTALTFGLLMLGLLLIVVEAVIIPGFGVAGISGIALVVFSVYAASVGLEGESFGERVIPDSEQDWKQVQGWSLMFMSTMVVGIGGALVAARHLHRVPFISKAFLRPPSSEDGDAVTTMGPTGPRGHVALRRGSRGKAETDLRPAGRASFDVGIVDVVSDGEWIPRGTAVRVLLVEGNRVVVAPATEDLA